MTHPDHPDSTDHADALRPFEGPFAWRGDELRGRTDWLHVLTDAERDELVAVAERFVDDDPDLRAVTAADYPLTACRGALDAWTHDLERGRGFVQVRGFPADEVAPAVSGAAFFLVALHLGTPAPLNADRDLIDHVYATSNRDYYADANARSSAVRSKLPFHSDASDVVALMCLQAAKSGGASSLVSGATLCNEVIRRRPDLAPLLFAPWYFDLKKQSAEGVPFFDSPICGEVDGVFSTYFGPGVIRSAQRYPEVPRLTPEQEEVLALLDEIAFEDGVALHIDFQPGDMQLLLNYAVLHSRTEFEDWPEPERQRHLLRFWLHTPANRPLPPRFGRYMLPRERNDDLSAHGRFRIRDAVALPLMEV